MLNKLILVTGASSGIGEACARIFAANGARLILSARRKERLVLLAKELQDLHGTACFCLELDVRNKEDVQSRLNTLPAEWQAVDVLINNAGLALSTDPIQHGLIDNWDAMIDTNVKGLLYVTHSILPFMLKRDQGHIINIGSIAGEECYPGGNVYCATKFAVKALTKSMRLDLLGSPIRITEISPGAVETEFSEVRFKDKIKAKEFYKTFKPLIASDVADAVYYCATRPPHVVIAEMTLLPLAQASANHIHRG